MTLPYYLTWSAQRNGATFPLSGAEGAELILSDGRRALDLISTNFQAAFGARHPIITGAIQEQLQDFGIASPKARFPLKEIQTTRLLKYLRRPDGKIFYTVSGAEAIENALKMARQMSGKRSVLARRRSYHGASMGALAVTGDWRREGHVLPLEWTIRIPEPEEDPDLSLTRKIIVDAGPEHLAAFCLESISGMNGVIIPERRWWSGIQQLASEFGLLLIVDEVTCGFERTGERFGIDHYGDVRPDFICMAKAITGGYLPFGAVWTSARVADFYEDRVLSCGLTNYAYPLGLAAMGAVLTELADPAAAAARRSLADAFNAELDELARLETVAAVRKKGLLAVIELADGRRLTWEQGLAAGLHLACKGSSVVLAPPYIMTTQQLQLGCSRLRELIT